MALGALGVGAGSPRQAQLRIIRDGAGAAIDQAMVIWFPGPHSFTGEDCAEVHLHGGRFIVEAVLGILAASGIRLAAPGEFTRRAFENGKLDLGQAEAVADLIDAECESQARQAIDQLQGALGDRYEAWRDDLIEVLARLEALVDFPDEDISAALTGVEARLRLLEGDLASALADGLRGRRVRDGYRVAIVGPVNAGKSSLFNRLVARDAAIVADLPGTTRDVIEAALDLGGYRLLVADTAGLRVSDDPVELEGIRRARAWADQADRRIWVIDGSTDDGGLDLAAAQTRDGDLCVLNKMDRVPGAMATLAVSWAARESLAGLKISTYDDGPDRVLEWVGRDAVSAMSGSDFPAVTRLRHDSSLREGVEAIRRALENLRQPELAAEDVRLAVRALAQITGSIVAEDVLEKVFATFCIGK